jgi:hypothetical protein
MIGVNFILGSEHRGDDQASGNSYYSIEILKRLLQTSLQVDLLDISCGSKIVTSNTSL